MPIIQYINCPVHNTPAFKAVTEDGMDYYYCDECGDFHTAPEDTRPFEMVKKDIVV